MENLEEVLQALEEFQKMRPNEIPRKLEDYLCRVAKTGDPVYQWSLIKTLFREKLMRVMTDLYESCPTLELAPCPNVEHFNYDTMKSNLLERLESFANAPFTVQRICELLTTPMKEYNRVDKFMRAIEKNILVVSTREPGPIARRSENGDSMVNGSVDEDASATQPPQDTEMEYWEKDCPSTVTISVHTVENEAPSLHTVMPTTTVVKSVFGTEEASPETLESTSSKSEITVSNFTPTTSEFSGVASLASQPQVQDSQITPPMQNLSTVVPETSGIVGDVPEAIMNEDTSSQPSLDLENDEGGDTVESTRKLQTTFQAKDFTSSENKSSKLYPEDSKGKDKVEGIMQVNGREASEKSDGTIKTVQECEGDNEESVNPIVENLLKLSDEKLVDKSKLDSNIENMQIIIEPPSTSSEDKQSSVLENSSTESIPSTSHPDNLKSGSFKPFMTEKDASASSENCATTITSSTIEDATCRIAQSEDSPVEATAGTPSADMSLETEDSNVRSLETDLSQQPNRVIEEPSPTEIIKSESFNGSQEKTDIVITESIEEEATVIKSMVPDPIPIIEEPRDAVPPNQETEHSASIFEIAEEPGNLSSHMTCEPVKEDKLMSVDNNDITELQGNNITASVKLKDDDTIMDNTVCKGEREPVELMDVDEEETLSLFQQDEPMEQDTPELSNS